MTWIKGTHGGHLRGSRVRNWLVKLAYPLVTASFEPGGITYIPAGYRIVPVPDGADIEPRWWLLALRWALRKSL